MKYTVPCRCSHAIRPSLRHSLPLMHRHKFTIDLSEHADYIAYILDRFESLQGKGHQSASDVAFLVMQILDFLPLQPQSVMHQQQTAAARIMQWVEEHYQQKFSLDELAADMGYSRSYTSRIFRQQTGGGIQEYILTRRIKKSCDLLRYSSLNVTEIAEHVGFTEMTYFITCFKKLMSQSPLQYRKQYGEAPPFDLSGVAE